MDKGLTTTEAQQRLHQFGPNRVPTAHGISLWKILWRQITNPLIYLLVVAGVAALALGRYSDSGVVLGVVFLNVLIGFFQEWRANRAVSSLGELIPEYSCVLRDGTKQQIRSEQIVPGDIVFLQGGDRIPADLRLLHVKSMRANESMLTGESLPVDKHIGDTAYEGTLVSQGTGSGVVTATATHTELHKIADLIAKAAPLDTPLTRQFTEFANRMTWIILLLAALLFAIALLQHRSVVDGVLIAVTLAVAAIPEGLPAVITIALAVGVRRMARQQAIIRELPAVETLGCTSVICTDKTGTLTRNQMVVQTEIAPNVKRLYIAAVLCSDASAHQGDPTEVALILGAEKNGCSIAEIRAAHPRIDEIPFESDRQWMATLHENLLCVKGAPEVLARLCLNVPADLSELIAQLAGQGMRLLACAEKRVQLRTIQEKNVHDLEWLGMVGLIDPARPEARAAVHRCQQAGIRIIMLTGDHQQTAEAIGRQIGISEVHSRVMPAQKLELVKRLQAEGAVVAMTGDGVNDGPALKQADIGIAMGCAGTAVAREAADLILADDNFATIAAAVEEGRHVYDNLVKAFAFVLPTNLGLALILIAGVLFFPTLMPMLPIQVLWINMVAAVALTLPFGFEAKEPDLMHRPPRPVGSPLLNSFIILRTMTVSCLMALVALLLFWSSGGDQTLVVTSVVWFQIFYLLSCRTLRTSSLRIGLWSNPSVYLGIVITLLLQVAYVELPWMQHLFSSQSLNLLSWVKASVSGALIGLVVTLEKKFLIRQLEARK